MFEEEEVLVGMKFGPQFPIMLSYFLSCYSQFYTDLVIEAKNRA